MSKINKSLNHVRTCNIISAILLMALLVCQLMPFWRTGTHEVSIQGYTWFPENHKEILEYLKAEANPETTVNSVVSMPIIVLISGFFGMILCAFKSENAWCASLAGICGIAGVIGYLTVPAFQVGNLWGLHLLLCVAVLAMAAATFVCGKNQVHTNA